MPDQTPRNWFDSQGRNYARFRPSYPPALAGALADLAPSTGLAVDVGCGTGQLTGQLAELFDEVIGADPSADQIANARPHPQARYVQAPAEDLPVPDQSAHLITAAQAAHWFNLEGFYRQVRRIATPGAVLALISYGVLNLEPGLDERFEQFYSREIGRYWPAQRALVDQGYRTLDFPFQETSIDPIRIEQRMTFDELLGYISTWSAVRAVTEAGREDILTRFADDLGQLWGEPDTRRQVIWPINTRIGAL